MARKFLLSTKDILEIELDYIANNYIPDREIGKNIHFYNYYSNGLAVLVSFDNNKEYETPQGNRKYSILKGSYAKVMNNAVQQKLLTDEVIIKSRVGNIEYYKFIKNSEPLSTGNVMLALTVSNSPSPKTYISYFSEDTRLQANLKDAEHADNSNSSILADGLSEEGFNIVTNKFIDSILNDRQDVLDKIAERIENIKNKQKHTYTYREYESNYTTKDIYSTEVITEALNILKDKHRLLITGYTGSGKTELTYFLANELTGEAIGEPADRGVQHYKRICVAGAGDGFTLWEKDDLHSTIGELRLFTEYIDKENTKAKNDNDKGSYCFICNEIQASDFRFLVGSNLFEAFNKDEQVDILPDNLYIIFTACLDRDFGIDSQILERIPSIELDYIKEFNCNEVHEKIIGAFGDEQKERVSKIVKLVGKINSTEEYQVISIRKMMSIINNTSSKLEINVNELSAKSKKAYEELLKI